MKLEAERQRKEAKRRASLLSTLPPEPSISRSSEAIAIALRLPSGHRQERKFSVDHPLAVVFQWAEGHGVDIHENELVTATLPQRAFR